MLTTIKLLMVRLFTYCFEYIFAQLILEFVYQQVLFPPIYWTEKMLHVQRFFLIL